MGILSQKILKFGVSERPFPGFSAGRFQGILKYEGKCCEEARKSLFSRFSPHYNVIKRFVPSVYGKLKG